MSIFRAMNTGVSGIRAEGEALGVVSDNVANANTVGFKNSRAIFADVLGGVLGANSVGMGVSMVKVQQIFGNGTLMHTGEATDLAINGDGFFVVNGQVGGVNGQYYTRAGQFTTRKDGTLVNPAGMELQGYPAKTGSTYSNQLSSIVLPTAPLAPKPTSTMSITANLDEKATVPTLAWDKENPANTANVSTRMPVYDSLGTRHDVDVYFRKTGAGTWEYHAVAPATDVAGSAAGAKNTEIATGTLTFGSKGELTTVGGATSTVTWSNGSTAGQPLTFDFGKPTSSGGDGTKGMTQFGALASTSKSVDWAPTAQDQDGYAQGDLTGVRVDADGTVNGVYSNTKTIPVAKLATAKFRSNDGLVRAGSNVWASSQASGDASIGAPSVGGRGDIAAGSLEQSNVDIAAQFVDLIAHQRAFSANSKSITTADEMTMETINLKR